MSYVSHDGLAYFKHKLDQKFISNITSENGALKIILGDGTVLKSIQDTTVTQKKSTANELYPLLLCYDAMADQDQLSKETWFGQHILANPYYGYLASRGMYVKHPTFNRRNGVSQKVEWAYDFTDAVSGLGNPMSQVYAYVDPASEGGEHCIELRLYGNPNVSPTVPSINDSTNTFSIGVGVTGGNVQFGYCPSTPLYLDNGSTLRTEATGHGNDIITRDWLNLNGSLTGLVHTTMNETIDGAKTFKKTVTINSGDNSNKAGLYVQGNSDVHGNEHVYGTETVDGKLTANGTAEIKGGSGNNPSLLVTGNETVTGKLTGTGTAEFSGGSGNTPTLTVNGNESVSGNSSVGGNISTTNGNISTTNGTVSGKTGSIGSGGLTVAGTTTSTGKITGNGGAEISGGSGLKINGNETVTGTTTVTGKVTANGGVEVNGNNGLVVNGNETVNGEIYKVVNNTPQEYVSYVTNKQETKTTIVNNLIKDKGGLAVDSNKNIYVSLKNNGGIKLNNNGELYVDFSLDSGASEEAQAAANAIKDQLLSSLGLQIPLTRNLSFYVNPEHPNATRTWKNSSGVIDKTVGTQDKPFSKIQDAIDCATQGYALGIYHIDIRVFPGTYKERLSLGTFNATTGYIAIMANDMDNRPVLTTVDNTPNDVIIAANTATNWRLTGLKCIALNRIASNDGLEHFPSILSCSTNSVLYIGGCEFRDGFVGDAPTSGHTYLRTLYIEKNSTINFSSRSDYENLFYFDKGNANSLEGILLSTNSTAAMYSSNSDIAKMYITVYGTVSTFLSVSGNSSFSFVGGGLYTPYFSVPENQSLVGKKYHVGGGAYIALSNTSIPGTIAGDVDSSRYGWVAGITE